ncbi:MAG: hypothetical protein LBI33_04310 [Propionibacteriaceae bacterium]|nr:hypothetical protein [Propionibacteriaceae bacterium]
MTRQVQRPAYVRSDEHLLLPDNDHPNPTSPTLAEFEKESKVSQMTVVQLTRFVHHLA